MYRPGPLLKPVDPNDPKPYKTLNPINAKPFKKNKLNPINPKFRPRCQCRLSGQFWNEKGMSISDLPSAPKAQAQARARGARGAGTICPVLYITLCSVKRVFRGARGSRISGPSAPRFNILNNSLVLLAEVVRWCIYSLLTPSFPPRPGFAPCSELHSPL